MTRPHHHIEKSDIIAIILVLLSYAIFSVADATIKYIAPAYDAFTVLFWDAFEPFLNNLISFWKKKFDSQPKVWTSSDSLLEM